MINHGMDQLTIIDKMPDVWPIQTAYTVDKVSKETIVDG